MSIMIAVPCMGTAPIQFTESLLNLEKPEGTKVCTKSSSLIYDARNLLSLTAIEQKFDYVMWFDSDMTFHPLTLMHLLEDMNHPHIDMVTGLYVKRTFPTKPVIYQRVRPPEPGPNGIPQLNINEYMDYPRDRMFCVEGCGFGCVLTSVQLLKDVWDKFGPAFSPLPWAGEDVSFCYRVNQLKKDDNLYPGHILCDSRVKCGHIGSFLFTEDLLKRGETT